MQPKPIGILGGAGPLAGALLFERTLSLAGSLYGCYRDADFPKVILISFPFSDMLSTEVDATQLRHELRECLNQLRDNGAAILAIACNTLHAFLEENANDLIHFPKAVGSAIPTGEIPLILCTSTSSQAKLHEQFFPCRYPAPEIQREIDQLIDQILRGTDRQTATCTLTAILEKEPARTVVLGCTELSLLSKYLSAPQKLVIDPVEIVATQILEISFLNIKRLK